VRGTFWRFFFFYFLPPTTVVCLFSCVSVYVCVRLYYFFEGARDCTKVFHSYLTLYVHTHVDHTSLCVCLLANLLLIKSTRSIVLVTCCVCGWITHFLPVPSQC